MGTRANPVPLSVAPVLVSDESAPVAVGLSSRRFRELVREHRIPHRVVGHRVLVRAKDLEAFVVNGARSSDEDGDSTSDRPISKEEILARAGFRRRA